jgi:ABC-2 type transport system ATP-binding protein
MISASRLTRHFGARVAVHDLSFEVRRSEIVALLGPNGAGKTTTMRMLAGLIAPTSGSVTIDDVRLGRETATELRGRIGFLTEAPGLWDRLTVRENLLIYARLYGMRAPALAVTEMLDRFELGENASARAAELSKGTRQKVALARALLHRPPILLLDEPMSGLDPEIRRSVRQLLEHRRDEGCAILVSTHDLDEAERLADRVALLHGQLIALDAPQALRRRLMTGRVSIRLSGDPAPFVPVVSALNPSVAAVDGRLSVHVSDVEDETPTLVAALVAAGARVCEVRPEIPALEDVYLHFMEREASTSAEGPSDEPAERIPLSSRRSTDRSNP